MTASTNNYVEGEFGHYQRRTLTREHHIWLGVSLALPLVLGVWAVTQWFAWRFEYASALGSGLTTWGDHPIYFPWKVLGWLWLLRNDSLAEVTQGRALLIAVGVLAVVIMCLTLSTFLRELRNRADELHDSGRYGREKELEEQDLLSERRPTDGIVLGAYRPDPSAPVSQSNRQRWVSDQSDTPAAVVGPPGGGKGVTVGIPTLLAHRGSAFVIDPKLEFFRLTSGYRSQVLKQRVGILDFFHWRVSLHYNFLDFIRLGTDYEIRDAVGNGIFFTDSTGRGLDDAKMEHWVQTPAGLLAAGCLHMMYRARNEHWGRPATMFDVAWELSGRDHPAVKEAALAVVEQLMAKGKPVPADPTALIDVNAVVLRSWMNYRHAVHPDEEWEIPGGKTKTHTFIALRAQEQLDRMKTPEGSGHLSTVRKVLSLFEETSTRKVTSRSDFRIEDLQALLVQDGDSTKEGITLYVPTPLADFKRIRPLYRALLCQAISRLTEEEKPAHTRRRLLMLLDEFTELGQLDIFASVFGVGRGYGIKPLVMFQSFGKLEKEWTAAGARGLLDNVETLIAQAPAPAATETANKLSAMTGRKTLTNRTQSRSSRALGGDTSRNESEREVARPVLTAFEIMTLPRTLHKKKAGTVAKRKDGTVEIAQHGHQLMFRKNIPVVTLLQVPHYSDPVYLRRSQIPPPFELPSRITSHSTAGANSARPSTASAAPVAPRSRLDAPAAPPGGWALPPDEVLQHQTNLEGEDASVLLELLDSVLAANGLDAELGQPTLTPASVVVPLAGAPDTAAVFAQRNELSAATMRAVRFAAGRKPAIALARVPSAPVALSTLAFQPHAELELPIATDLFGTPIVHDLATAQLTVSGDAKRLVESWLALLVLELKPSELAIDLLIEDLRAPWPHVTRWDAQSYEEAMKTRTPDDRRLRVVVTRHPVSVGPMATILWIEGGCAAAPALRVDGSIGTWRAVEGTETDVDLALITDTELSALENHWCDLRPKTAEPLGASVQLEEFDPTTGNDMDGVNADDLLLQLAGAGIEEV